MTDTELEALAYILGDSAAAELLARMADMQAENDALSEEVEELKSKIVQNDKDQTTYDERMQAENDALTCEVEDLRSRVAELEREALCK